MNRQRDLDRLRDEKGRLRTLARLEAETHAAEASFDHITALVSLILGLDMVAISLIDADTQRLKARQGLETSTTPRELAFCSVAIRSYEPLVVEDARRDPRFRENPLVTGPPYLRCYIGAPLTTEDGYNLGTICALGSEPRRFTEREVDIMRRFAELIIQELELRSQANRDFLTGVHNRRAFAAELKRELSRLQRRPGNAAVAFLDVDHFKQVNDTYGHPVGDRVLRELAEVVRENCRATDVLARLGGEEFALLLPGADICRARALAERLRRAVAEHRFTGIEDRKLTVSIGLVGLREAETTPDAVESAADHALYQAKRRGRNCVFAA